MTESRIEVERRKSDTPLGRILGAMPIYTCTSAVGTLTDATKASLAAEITRIHVAANHVPAGYVNVVFSEPGHEAQWLREVGPGAAGPGD
jgi:phenylpyruvate tautomerase PptA (4-oxalocrotonate tautomerase family)